MNHKSTLAKLLAKENITVQYGNYHTAWFDIKDRILGLPQWKDMGKDVTDLLIGHEVGHALYTPFEGWHDSPEKLEGCPRSYINVIEDARIERHIKENYAGLIGPMSRGYKKLFDDGFFGEDLDSMDWDNVKLIDKINLKAKVGNLLDVPFTDEEIVFYQRAMKTSTFAEVTDLVRDILAYTKENTPELIEQPKAPQSSQSEGTETKDEMGPSGHDDYDKESNNEEQDTETKTPAEGTEEGDSDEGTSENQSADRSENDDAQNQGNVENQPVEEDVSLTDENFRRKEHTLLDRDERGSQLAVGNEFRKEIRDRIVISYDELAKDRNARGDMDEYEDKRDEFKSYMQEVKRNTNYAVKEFEMRKAAYRYTRAQTAKTGSIDVNRLWSYKTNDDIFSRVTKLADAKNHGMMLLIDYSGSMSNTMGQVMDQLLHLVTFCKTVNIPFDVYGFTSTNINLGRDAWGYSDENYDGPQIKEGEINHCGLAMPNIISSSLKKGQYEDALFHIYLRKILCECEYSYSERSILSRFEDYGSTPLNEALITSHRLIKQFKNKNAVDKMNLVVLSDGEANRMALCRSSRVKYTETDDYGEMVINIDNQKIKLGDRGRKATRDLLLNLQKRYDAKTLGFFIADGSSNFWYKISDARCDGIGHGMYDSEDRKPYNRQYGKHKCVTFQDTLGYNEFYIVKNGKFLKTEDDGFDVAADASTGQIRAQFKKYSKSKKNNKTLLTNFGKAVA